ncbi:MAG: FIST N-terminal domain-containing protein [Thiotrichales bacterium]
MSTFAFGLATGTEPRTLVNTLLAQLGDPAPSANLGFVYATDALARELPRILQLLAQATGIAEWTGSVGMALNCAGREIYDQPAIAVLLGEFPPDSFRVLPNQKSAITALPQSIAAWRAAHQPRFAVLHGDPSNPAIPSLIEQLSESLGDGFFVGGLTSSQSESLQIANGAFSGGLSGVLFAPEVVVAAGHTQGCSPIGPIHQVTRAERNIIATLDHRPAVEVMKEDIGEVLARDLNRLGGYIFVGLPLPHSDTGDYLVRNLLGLDVGNGLLAIGEMIATGNQIMFCRRDGNTAREDMLRMLQNLKQRCGGQTPHGGLYFSCLGRGRNQFGDNAEEMGLITEVLGEFPLVGFFANGEIFNNRLYGYTGVLNLFLGAEKE